MNNTIVLLIRFETRPGQRDLFVERLASLVKTMSHETDFVNAVLHTNLDEPDVVVIYETWRGTRETWLQQELPRPYRLSYENELAQLVASRTVQWLVPLSGP
ncbi:hypothetical protein JCM19000A_35410 [Silvimonas sp. JCM 19000]